MGTSSYVNQNCWLAKTLGYAPAKRCFYCQLKLKQCPFIQYLLVSIVLIVVVFSLAFLTERRISKITLLALLLSVLTYGYFFNKSTEKIIEANFIQKKAKEELEKTKATLEMKVAARTRKLKRLANRLDEEVKERTKELQSKMESLEKFQRLTVGRELKMLELKKEVENLRKEVKRLKKLAEEEEGRNK